MVRRPSLCIPSSELNFPHSSQSEGTGSVINTDSSTLAIQALGGRDSPTAFGPAVAPPSMESLKDGVNRLILSLFNAQWGIFYAFSKIF